VIGLKRNRSEKSIPPQFYGDGRISRQAALVRDHRAGNLKLTSNKWKLTKPALHNETWGKCAYCEAPADATAHCDVEHFRPKITYWWLALCYDNYVYACQICNQVYKGDHFPISGARLPEPNVPSGLRGKKLAEFAAKLTPDPLAPDVDTAPFFEAWNAERPDLVHPYLEDPERYFAWEADNVTKEVRLVPRSRADSRVERAVKSSIKYLGLNRETLIRLRYRHFRLLEPLAEVARSAACPLAVRQEAVSALRDATADGAMFAGMARHFVKNVWKVPFP